MEWGYRSDYALGDGLPLRGNGGFGTQCQSRSGPAGVTGDQLPGDAWFFREALRRHRLGVNEGRHLIVQRGV